MSRLDTNFPKKVRLSKLRVKELLREIDYLNEEAKYNGSNDRYVLIRGEIVKLKEIIK